LQLPLTYLQVHGEDIVPIFRELIWNLDLPFGDPVTGPLYLLEQAAQARGLRVIFNGEGGDQLFGGWTSKPMISA
jgi:asparagine synthase (glutamine-hydrolysing)